MVWRKGLREAALALVVAMAVLLPLTMHAPGLLRDLETASLDLRFRLRGAVPPGPEIAVVLVDEDSISRLGRWPLSRRRYAKAVEILDRAGARVIAFDLLFAEPERPVPNEVRARLAQIAEDEPDAGFAASLKANGKTLLALAFSSFSGEAEEAPPVLSEQVYLKLDQSPTEPFFPLQPSKALLPVPVLAESAAGLGHVNIAFDRDGAPRYDYLALPFSGDFVASLPVRAAAAYR